MITGRGDEPRSRSGVIFDATKPKAPMIGGQEYEGIAGKLSGVDGEAVRDQPLDWRDIDRGTASDPCAKFA